MCPTLDRLLEAGEVTAEEARVALGGKKKRSKYGAVRCELDGFKFDSKAEMGHYAELALRQLFGEIRGLAVHPVYPLKIHGVHVADYEPDFVYTICATGKEIVEDVKSGGKKKNITHTALSRLKIRIFEVLYPHLKVDIIVRGT